MTEQEIILEGIKGYVHALERDIQLNDPIKWKQHLKDLHYNINLEIEDMK